MYFATTTCPPAGGLRGLLLLRMLEKRSPKTRNAIEFHVPVWSLRVCEVFVCVCKVSDGCEATKKLRGENKKKNWENKKKRNVRETRIGFPSYPSPYTCGMATYARQSIHSAPAQAAGARYKPRSRSKLTFAFTEKLCFVVVVGTGPSPTA